MSPTGRFFWNKVPVPCNTIFYFTGWWWIILVWIKNPIKLSVDLRGDKMVRCDVFFLKCMYDYMIIIFHKWTMILDFTNLQVMSWYTMLLWIESNLHATVLGFFMRQSWYRDGGYCTANIMVEFLHQLLGFVFIWQFEGRALAISATVDYHIILMRSSLPTVARKTLPPK